VDISREKALEWLAFQGIANPPRYLSSLKPGEQVRTVFDRMRRKPGGE
jgi:hypothetical protein